MTRTFVNAVKAEGAGGSEPQQPADNISMAHWHSVLLRRLLVCGVESHSRYSFASICGLFHGHPKLDLVANHGANLLKIADAEKSLWRYWD